MLNKIISGINPGVERAILNFASEYGISHSGWIPECQRSQFLQLNSDLNEINILPNSKASDCMRKNVLSSDATLLITYGELFGNSDYYRKAATTYKKKWLHLDLKKTSPFQCALDICDWLIKNNIRVLTVSGSKITDAPSIEKTVRKIFEAVWKTINEKESSAAL
jgi:hypothetical protein